MADDPEKPERTTSFAKTIDREALAPPAELKKEFDRAKTPRQTSRERTTADTQSPAPERATSFSKTLDPAAAQSSRLKKQFDRAKAGEDRQRDQGGHGKGRPTTARHDPTATARPRPTGLEADASDRKAFNERQAKLARAEAALQRVAQQNALKQDRGRGR